MRPPRNFPDWVRYLLPTTIITGLIALIGLTLGFVFVNGPGNQALWVEIGKLGAQFLLFVLLSVLVTHSIERLRDHRAKLQASRERKESHAKRLIEITHDIDLARLLISANRSVRTWSEQMTSRLIPAYTELRDLQHDHKTAIAAGQPIFDRGAAIRSVLEEMSGWLKDLCDEFAEEKKNLYELQLLAEKDQTRQVELWRKMQELSLLGDLLKENGTRYGRFRDSYRQALTIMRSEFSASNTPAKKTDPIIESVIDVNASAGRGIPAGELGGVRCFLVGHKNGVVLIDTGTADGSGRSKSVVQIDDALKRGGFKWRNVTDVVLTHAHTDHIGGLTHVLKKAPHASLWAGAEDIPDIAVPGDREIEVLNEGSFVRDLRVLKTPGHTPGHISLMHDDVSVLFIGNAAETTSGRIARPPDAADVRMAEESLRRLAALNVDRVLFSHGEEIPDPQQALRSLVAPPGSSTRRSRCSNTERIGIVRMTRARIRKISGAIHGVSE